MSLIRKNLLILCACALAACQSNPSMNFEGKTESERINKFFEYSFNTFLERSPQGLSYLGVNKKQDKLDTMTEEFAMEEHELRKKHHKILKSFDYEALDEQAKVSYEVYERRLRESIEGWKWRDYGYSVNQMFGVQTGLPAFMINIHRVKTEKDLQNYIARLGEFKRVFGEVITGLMRSETKGIVPPTFVFAKTILDSQNVIAGFPFTKSKTKSPLWDDFNKKLASLKLSKEKQKQYRDQATAALRDSVKPGYESLISFLQKQEKRSKKTAGVWKFPEGDKFYSYRLQRMTTTDMTADQIHELGLKNVKRIHGDMKKIKEKVGFKGSLSSFFRHMQGKKYLPTK